MFNLFKIQLVLFFFILQLSEVAARDVYVRGHVRTNGTYVAPHMRSTPDSNFYNNWSTTGNVNPYTGKEGTKTEQGNGYINPIRTLPKTYPTLIQQDEHLDETYTTQPQVNNASEPVTNSGSSTSPSSNAIQIPLNSKIDYTGHGWECKHGFYQNGSSCEELKLPSNAKVDYTGHGWECKPGYLQIDNECRLLTMPENSKIDYTGHNWECKSGFRQVANTCLSIALPLNAKIDYTGHDWECKSGYKQVSNACVALELPENAKIDYTGHHWECKSGYRQSSNSCELVKLPANAKIDYTGHSWECKYGFRQIGDECLRLNSSN